MFRQESTVTHWWGRRGCVWIGTKPGRQHHSELIQYSSLNILRGKWLCVKHGQRNQLTYSIFWKRVPGLSEVLSQHIAFSALMC